MYDRFKKYFQIFHTRNISQYKFIVASDENKKRNTIRIYIAGDKSFAFPSNVFYRHQTCYTKTENDRAICLPVLEYLHFIVKHDTGLDATGSECPLSYT